MIKLDKKFYGDIYKVKNNEYVLDDEWVIFLAKDNAFAAILPLYRDKCIELGCDQEQIQAVNLVIYNVEKWRAAYPNRLKNPDAANEKMLP